MNYLGRPVFEFPVNWASPASKSFSFDLKEVALGFGESFFTSLQSHVSQGWQFQVDLTDGTQIESFDAFTGALFGRLVGFWLPAPMEGMKVVAAVDTTHFDIKAQGLAGTWQDHPDVYLYFARDGYASAVAKITAVADNGATERVTINAAVNVNLLNAEAMVSRLHYVRLASDEETGEFPAQNWQSRFVKVVELPKEYAAIETGLQPIYLYHFWANFPVGVHWYYAGFAANVVSNNVVYSKFGIEHGGISQSTKGNADNITIDAKPDANHPFSLYLPLPFARPLNVEVIEVDYSDLDTQRRLFTGQVRNVTPGETISAKCDSFGSILKKKSPRHLIGADCGNTLYDPATCKAKRFKFETTGAITILNEFTGVECPSIVTTLSTPTASRKTANYFAQGFMECGVGLNYELRVIVASTWNEGTQRLTLTLNAPLEKAVVGDQVQLIPGCDGTKATCISKFDNYDNFGGWPFVPKQNPTIASVQQDVAGGGKK